jgi:hypothetical protein
LADFAISRALPTFVPCDLRTGDRPCALGFIADFAFRAFRRPPTEAESADLRDAFDTRRATGTFADGIRAIVARALASPAFYTVEQPGRPGQFLTLSPYAVATRLSYFLTQSTPDRDLLTAAAAGTLANRAGVEQQVRRLLSTQRAHEAVKSFFRQWLYLDVLDEASRISGDFDGTIRYMKTEMELFTEAVFFGGARWSELFVGTRTFMNEPLATLYGKAGLTGLEFQPTAVDSNVRGGLFTQLGFLTINAWPDFGSPTLRGWFIRSRVLCKPLPMAPSLLDGSGPPEQTTTNRARYETIAAKGPNCEMCHALTDPIGYAFEHFDALGRYRETDNSYPIDATGTITGAGEDLAAGFDGAIDLSRKLSMSAEVRTCMAKQWFRFALLRSETDEDRCSIEAAVSALQNGGTLPDLVVALATSDAFRYARW